MGEALPEAGSEDCRVALRPCSGESLMELPLDDLLDFGLSTFSLVGNTATTPADEDDDDDCRLDDLGNSGKSRTGEFGPLVPLLAEPRLV